MNEKTGMVVVAALLLSALVGCGEPADWNSVNDRAKAAFDQGDYPQAEALFEKALEVAESDGDEARLVVALNNIGELHRATGRVDLALPYYARALTIREGLLAPGDPELATNHANLAMHYRDADTIKQLAGEIFIR